MSPKSDEQATGKAASRLIDQRIKELEGWRDETLARMRALILEADPEMIEEWKWGGPGLVARRDHLHRGDVHEGREAHVRQGRQLPDPSGLFNSSLEGNTRRAIDIHEGEKVDARAFKALVKAAVALNGPLAKKR